MSMDRYAAAEGFYKLAMAFAPVPDLHIMWLLHLCDAHQEMQSWAEAAQCAVAVAAVVMQVLYVWFSLYGICSTQIFVVSVLGLREGVLCSLTNTWLSLRLLSLEMMVSGAEIM